MTANYITRGEIIGMLKKWQDGALSTRQIWDWASHCYQAGAADFDDWTNRRRWRRKCWQRWKQERAQLDYSSRKLQLRNDPIYALYCD